MAASQQTAADEGTVSFGMLTSLLGFQLRRAQAADYRHFAETVTAQEGLTPGVFGLLHIVAANPGRTQSRLAQSMKVDRSAILKVINLLEERGLVVRAPSAHDRRSQSLCLTERGWATLNRMEPLVLAHEQDFAKTLTPAETRTLLRLLERLCPQAEDS